MVFFQLKVNTNVLSVNRPKLEILCILPKSSGSKQFQRCAYDKKKMCRNLKAILVSMPTPSFIFQVVVSKVDLRIPQLSFLA